MYEHLLCNCLCVLCSFVLTYREMKGKSEVYPCIYFVSLLFGTIHGRHGLAFNHAVIPHPCNVSIILPFFISSIILPSDCTSLI